MASEEEGWYQKYMLNMEELILQYGHMVQGVFPTEDAPGPSFAYSVGLQDAGWPELIMVGVNINTATVIINDTIRLYRAAEKKPTAGDCVEEVGNFPLYLATVSNSALHEYLCQAVHRAERMGKPEPAALQIVIPDRAGVFPWQPGYDHAYMDPAQPCLAEAGKWPQLSNPPLPPS